MFPRRGVGGRGGEDPGGTEGCPGHAATRHLLDHLAAPATAAFRWQPSRPLPAHMLLLTCITCLFSRPAIAQTQLSVKIQTCSGENNALVKFSAAARSSCPARLVCNKDLKVAPSSLPPRPLISSSGRSIGNAMQHARISPSASDDHIKSHRGGTVPSPKPARPSTVRVAASARHHPL